MSLVVPRSCRRVSVLIAGILITAAFGSGGLPALAEGPEGVADRAAAKRIDPAGSGTAGDAKLDLNLRALKRSVSGETGSTRAPNGAGTGSEDALRCFGLRAASSPRAVQVAISVDQSLKDEALTSAGARVHFREGDQVFASVPVAVLTKIAALEGVLKVQGVEAGRIPKQPDNERPAMFKRSMPTRRPKELDFDHQGFTGKGVIVGVIDTGIDWRHKDFLNADGSTRILYLYDFTDNSWQSSIGRIGTPPPLNDEEGKPLGTLYTRDQINRALKGAGTVNSLDTHGHGTACAGTAAGNGSSVPQASGKDSFAGVAPGADLIVIRGGDGMVSPMYPNALHWMIRTARDLNRPFVANLSFGAHFNAHDGNTAEELWMDKITGAGRPGVAVCVSAGNERSDHIHAGGRFGPARPGQADQYSGTIGLQIYKRSSLHVCVDGRDDWSFGIRGLDRFLVTPDGKKVNFFVWSDGGQRYYSFESGSKAYDGPIGQPGTPSMAEFYPAMVAFAPPGELAIELPAGNYECWAFGATANVPHGRFDLYLGDSEFGRFKSGTEERCLVGAPGNARNVITVGAYDHQGAWANRNGEFTYYNLPEGEISRYSCPGYSRSGTIKPDIAAPATFAISPLARLADGSYSTMGMTVDRARRNVADNAKITKDGYHVAWMGTSAASPYVAGVIALMLEKNPRLDAAEIKKILTTTALRDEFTQGVPNRDWGWGKVNPAAALRATPLP